MKNNDFKGKLIAFDGPNGAGKTTLITSVQKRLEDAGYNTFVTKEPTDTELGRYVRSFSEGHGGISLACLVMCDRYEHLKNEIVPALENGQIVITDRYILSSLILQGIDGVDFDYILNLGSMITKPDLQIAVFANEAIIQERLNERIYLTRFEKDNQSQNELFFMRKGIELLRKNNIFVVEIDNNSELDQNVEKIISSIICVVEEKK